MTTFQLNFYNDDTPVKTCVTNQMLNDVPSSTNQILNGVTAHSWYYRGQFFMCF